MANYPVHIQDSTGFVTDSIVVELKKIGGHLHSLEIDSYEFLGLNISNDTVFTVITTLCVFMTGIIIDRLIVILKDARDRKETISIFKALVEQLSPYIEKRVKQFRSIEEDTPLDYGLVQIPPRTTNDRFKRIYELDTNILLKSSQQYSQIIEVWKNIDFIKLLSDSSDEYYNTFRAEDDSARQEFTTLTEDYNESLANFLDKYKPGFNDINGTTELKILINNAIVKFYEHVAGGGSLQYFYDEIIRPIQEYIINYKLWKNDQLEEIVFPIIDKGKILSHRFNALKQRNSDFKNQYKQLADAMEIAGEELLVDSKKL
jgi:hypothetical protein